MTILGITGGSGSGKTTFLRAVEERGGLVLDCDAIYHELLTQDTALLAALDDRFPGTVEHGVLHREALAAIVFANPDALQDLNAITHGAVVREVKRRLSASTAPLAAIDAIALFESGLHRLCDTTVCIVAPERERVARLMARDGISAERAETRIRAQKSDAVFQSRCAYCLHNDTTPTLFLQQCRALLDQLTLMKGPKNMKEEFQSLRDSLLFQPKHGYDRLSKEDREAMEAYCRRYMRFMDAAKMEREAVDETIRMAKEAGFVELTADTELKPGMRVYVNNRGKSALFAVIGSKSLAEGAHITASHVDSPRLDLKPRPLSEENEMAYLKTHYYGGIKKYQWTTIPLAIHGVVCKKDGTTVSVCIGEDENDPVFCITDILVHLAADQMKRSMAEGIIGERMQVLVGTTPLADDDGADRMKLAVMKLLHDKYGIVEADFQSAELTMVPAGKSREYGLDRSLIGAYGHDDRVCAYAAFEPMLDLDVPEHTAVCVLADKEEIGSMGVSGMQSMFFDKVMADLCQKQGVERRECFANSICLSTDVTNAYDPMYGETCDLSNNARVNYGIGIAKYTGSRGKGGCSDAAAEVVLYVRKLFEDNEVFWQTCELGKIDQGGGGTVAQYMANRNIATIDAGVPVLSMHAPLELVAKLDCYMTRKGICAFYHD